MVWRDLWPRWRLNKYGERAALDLEQMQSALTMRRVPKTEWPAVYAGLLTMEDEAIGIWASEE